MYASSMSMFVTEISKYKGIRKGHFLCRMSTLETIVIVFIYLSQSVLNATAGPSRNELEDYCDPNPPLGTAAELYSYLPYNVGWLKEGTKEHTIKGEVFIIDKYRFKIRNFTYDGEAPSTYVLAMKKGTSGIYSGGGYMLHLSGLNEIGETKYSCTNLADPAYRYGNLSLIVSLPAGKYPDLTTRDIRGIAIYSYEFCVNFRSREILEVAPGPAYDITKGEITPYCDVKEDNHKILVEALKECKDFPEICRAATLSLTVHLLEVLVIIVVIHVGMI